MCQFAQFQVYQYMAFEYAMIENQVNIEILVVVSHPFLTCHKAETTPQFEQELLQVVNQSLFQDILMQCRIILQIQEFQYKRIPNELLRPYLPPSSLQLQV